VAVLLHLGDDATVIEAIGVILKKGSSATLNPCLLGVVRKQFTETVVDEANVLFKLRRIEDGFGLLAYGRWDERLSVEEQADSRDALIGDWVVGAHAVTPIVAL
jgi:hypothetical protein